MALKMRRAEKRIRDHVAALSDPDNKLAERAEVLLIRHYGSRPIDLLIEACDGTDEATRYRAAWILGKTRDSHAFDTLVRLTSDPSPAVRYDATIALGRLGDPRAIDPLVRILCAPDPIHPTDSAAVEALAMLGKPVAPALVELANSDDPEILLKVAWTLRLLKDETTIGMAKALAAHQDDAVRMAALEALEAIAENTSALR